MAEKDWPETTGTSAMDLEPYSQGRGERRKPLIVSSLLSDENWLRAYAAELGKRIESEVVLVREGPLPSRKPKGTCNDAEILSLKTRSSIEALSSGPGAEGSEQFIQYVVDGGDLVSVVSRLCEKIKRIELILTDSPALKEALSETTMIPIFGIIAQKPKQGGYIMKTKAKSSKSGVVKTLVLGALTAAMYAAVFWKSDAVMQLFTRGGVYAAFPILTVFAFSFAHGAFASNLWSLLGIQAKPTVEVHKTVAPGVKASKTKVKRPRVHAYVNPFHNIHIKAK
jgi:hypothetical protein